MIACIDAGHGQDNRRPGRHDPGATHEENGVTYKESVIALEYAKTLREILIARGHQVVMTRDSEQKPCPVGRRAAIAEAAKANVLVSLHLNDWDDDRANGIEVQYNDAEDKSLAAALQRELLAVTGFKDHGNDYRPELAVLRFRGPAVLIELGFIANDGDRTTLLNPEKRWDICRAIAKTLVGWWEGRGK